MKNQPAIYIANLGRYNEGVHQGAWFTFPVDKDEVAEKIGLNEQYEECAIHDHEHCPFPVSEYSDIATLNYLAEISESLDEEQLRAAKEIIEYGCVSSFAEAVEKINDGALRFFYDCNSMKDVAWEIVEEAGYLDNMPEIIRNHFDYESYGHELETSGTFIYIGAGVYVEYIG